MEDHLGVGEEGEGGGPGGDFRRLNNNPEQDGASKTATMTTTTTLIGRCSPQWTALFADMISISLA
ncbi:hypothetical protein TYRP_022497 [Tyrophagus putrescentiae]|nr:hypothetical protein TYRP_022497 [Tyrophagus putrescentiae]